MLLIFCILNVLYLAYISKHNSNKEKQFILSMIPNREEWHYLPIKNYHYY